MTGERFAPGIESKDLDLVAYGNFDKGAGWTVHDITGHGHHLTAAENPRWEVVHWLSVCGNGVLEGLEECDDRDVVAGDGCSAECKVVKDWSCTKTSPSQCIRGGAGGSGSSSHSGSHHSWAVSVIVLVVVGLALTALVACWELICGTSPQVESTMHSLLSWFGISSPRKRPRQLTIRRFQEGPRLSRFHSDPPPPFRGPYLPSAHGACPRCTSGAAAVAGEMQP
ncbi:hypothetical protein D9Q98_004925 [Chlorella vulgaris]|uniref:Uncharacterized protein n=1 Tax=Chlorella vulgaris TaxID=3077 RepID=A0A9D4YWJ4_CHLVU|nr:hypothetical protein D9Q98_004925 [Chlorella vulgaris]